MRMFEISPTAGYAAILSPLNEQAANSAHIHSLRGEPNQNGNPKTLNTDLVCVPPNNGSGFSISTSADDFVQRALNSSTNSEYVSNTQHLDAFNQSERILKAFYESANSVQVTEGLDTYIENNENNENIYQACSKDFTFNKKNAEDSGNKNIPTRLHNTGDDNVELTLNSLPNLNSKYYKCEYYTDFKHANQNTIDMKNIENIKKQSQSYFGAHSELSNFNKQLSLTDQDDAEDLSITNLCATSGKSSVNICEAEESLTSPTSSDSLDISKNSYFPRGIINPNYPGFQHFAHTLSEHFIRSSSSETYDSDISEYEMELSEDSFDDLSVEQAQSNENINNNNDKDTFKFDTKSEDSLHFSSDLINQTGNPFSEEKHYIEMTFDANCNAERQKLQIQKTEDSVKNKFMVGTLRTPILTNVTAHDLDSIESSKPYTTTNCSSTPDILIKNRNQCMELLSKKENRPDLLHGVSPHHMANKSVQLKKCGLESVQLFSLLTTQNGHSETAKDEITLGVTPVDIIGDFEQEVEREFGLLVSGYRRMVDVPNETGEDVLHILSSNSSEKLADAVLSNAKETLDSAKFIVALNQYKPSLEAEDSNQAPVSLMDCTEKEDNNAVDWSGSFTKNKFSKVDGPEIENTPKPKYQKPSYDDRQLPPVAIDYKRCAQSLRSLRKIQTAEKSVKTFNSKITRNTTKSGFANRFLNTRDSSNATKGDKSENNGNKLREAEEKELHQYHQLISDKQSILNNSKYTKLSSWAQYLKNSAKHRNSRNGSDLISPSALELFDAYKIGVETDMETLEKHLKLAKEIEKKRRSDREEIRRRLAMGADESAEQMKSGSTNKVNNLSNGVHFRRITDVSSDNESHSSDSETCPKLSKIRIQHRNKEFYSLNLAEKNVHQNGKSLTNSCTNNTKQTQQQPQELLLPMTNEDNECDFFTKQARLQIEARLALAQAKEMAHMQMEIDRQGQCLSPITEIVRGSLEKIGINEVNDKRRVSRQMLTDLNITQLQILVNTLHSYIEELNESLVNFLMERDDLHMGQDSMLADIEELTRYIGTKEQLAKQQQQKKQQKKQTTEKPKKSYFGKRLK